MDAKSTKNTMSNLSPVPVYLPVICEKGYQNKPLTEEQKKMNREKPRIRCRVEHVWREGDADGG